MSVRPGMSSMSLSSLPSISRSRIGASVYSPRGTQSFYATKSASFDLSAALGGNEGNLSVSTNEKATMQNLNDRLSAYLDKVRRLEAANEQLERQIREWYDKQTPTVRDYSKYQVIIDDLRKKIYSATQDNARLMLSIDNAKLAGEDFRIKLANEQDMRMSVESDIIGLRKVLDELTLTRSDLEMQIEGLKEELVYLKKNHAEELEALRNNVTSSSVNVEVDAKPQEDMNKVLEDMRSQYNGIVDKNRRQMDEWYKAKFDELNKQMISSTETLQTSRSEINELKRTLQGLEIELQSQLSLKAAMEGTLGETESRYSLKLRQLQAMVDSLQNELGQMKEDIGRQALEYQTLLDVKTRLEMEIAEYRRLLDGEELKKNETITVQKIVVKEVKEEVKPEPRVTMRTRVVVEELVDGKIVSRTEDVGAEVLKK